MAMRLLIYCMAVPIAFVLCTTLNAQEPDRQAADKAIERGKSLYAKREWAKALQEFAEAVKADPYSAAAFEYRATTQLQLGELDKAIKDFDEAIRLNPKLASAFSNRGAAWQMKGEMGKAKTDYTEAIRLYPRYSPAYKNRANILAGEGKLNEAIVDYTEAIRINTEFVDAFIGRGDARRSLGDFDNALKDYDEALKLDAKSVKGLYSRARLRATCTDAKFRDGAKAVSDAKAAYDLPGNKSPLLLEVLAAAHAEAGDFPEAVKWIKRALEDKEYSKARGEEARARLKLYEEEKPYREEFPKKP